MRRTFSRLLFSFFGFLSGLLGGIALTRSWALAWRREARTDYLTGVLNPRGFDEALTAELERSRRFGRLFSLVYLDLDHFKEVNDRFGHAEGDRVLKSLIKIVNAHIRKIDRFGRRGGDEFVLLLPETDLNGSRRVAEKLRAAVAKASLRGVTLSVGVAVYPKHGKTRGALYKSADQAVYQAKRKRNRVVAAR